jgi:transcriptional regulator with XRE-family HTH domain
LGEEKMAEKDPRVLFGRRLAQVRKQKGWSQEKLALESGIARSYLGGVERGQRNIALINICKLAETLDVPVGELFVFDQTDS